MRHFLRVLGLLLALVTLGLANAWAQRTSPPRGTELRGLSATVAPGPPQQDVFIPDSSPLVNRKRANRVEARTCSDVNGVDFSGRTLNEDWKGTSHTLVSEGTTLTGGGSGSYFSRQGTAGNTTTPTSSLSVQDVTYGRVLYWTADYSTNGQGNALGPDNASNYCQLTLNLNRTTTGFALTINDIDRAVSSNDNAGWLDYVRIDGYAPDGSLITLSASDITLGTNGTNAYYGQNIVYGTGSNTTTEGNVTVLFPSAINKVILTYKNAQNAVLGNANSPNNPGSQIIGLAGFTWCAQADVYTTLTQPASLSAGIQSGNYTVVFGNSNATGTDNAANVTRVVTVPANTASAVTASGATVTGDQTTGWTLTYPTLPTLAANTSTSFQFTIRPIATASAAVTSTIGTSTDETSTANNTVTVTQNITPVADLTTTLAGPGSLASGIASGNYTVTYTNNGPSVAASVARTVTISNAANITTVTPSAGSAVNNGTNWVITFPAGSNVPSGSTATYTFTITPAGGSGNQTITATSNTSGTTSQGLDAATNTASVSYTVNTVTDVTASFGTGSQADNSSVPAGTVVTYNAVFTNSSATAAANVTRVVTLSAGTPVPTAAGATSIAGSQAAGWTITYPGGAIPAGNSVTYPITFAAPATGTVTVTVATTTSTGQLLTNNDSATRTLTATPIVLSGTVFDDVNYGGGAGRPYGTASLSAQSSGITNGAIGCTSATVELYDADGKFVATTTTNSAGLYSFNLPVAATYTVRVVNASVNSVRNSTAVVLIPVQTYRYNDVNRVGGENPAYVDADANTGTQLLSALSSGTVTPQSVVSTAVTTSGLTGIDFGFNFDTVVNTNDVATVSGTNAQGSLRQFIINANALPNASLNQVPASSGGPDPAAGVETSIFMITNGQAHPGLRSGLANLLNGSGVAVITPVAALPALTGTNSPATSIDGTTQTQNIGDLNSAILGTGGFVGATGTTALLPVSGPEVQLVGTTAIGLGLDVAASATGAIIKGLAVYGFGNAIDNNTNANIRNAANNTLITQNVLGSAATAFAAPATLTNADNVRLTTGTAGIIVSNNLIGFANGKGVAIGGGVIGVSVTGNEVSGNGQGGNNMDGVDIQGRNASITNNLFTGTAGQGIDSYRSTGNNVITGNTVSDNGRGTATVAAGETPGIRIFGQNNTVSQNLIFNNYGAGIMLEGLTNNGGTAAVATTLMSQNAIYNNGNVLARNGAAATGQLGIDLQVNGDNEVTGTSPFVTLNTPSGTNGGANGLLNYPILRTAYISGGNLIVTGYASPNATIELFTAQANPAGVNAVGANFGQGRTYLTTVTEGATTGVVDTDPATGITYSGNINGSNQGSDNNASGFTFVIPLSSLPGGTLAAGTLLTSTATLGGATSEFSGNATALAPLTGYVYEDVNYGGGLGRSRATLGTAAIGRPGAKVELYGAGGAYVATAITDANGQYSFNVPAGTGYTVRVVNNSVLSSRSGATAASGSATTGYVSNQLGVQTYVSNASATIATNRVGGERPDYTDAAANTTNLSLTGLNGPNVTAESIATVAVGTGTTNVGPDFGFNFDVIVNNNDAGQGSLRQFINNSNALTGESTLAQVYTPTAGAATNLAPSLETSIFMIPNGAAVAGLRTGLTSGFGTPDTGSGSATTILLTSALPDVTGAATAIDGSTQTRATGNSNAATTTLNAESNGPEVMLNLGGQSALTFKANNDQLIGMGVYNSTNSGQGVVIDNSAQNIIIQNNTIYNNGANITFTSSSTASAATITGNIIRNSQRTLADGIELNGNNSNMTITNNQLLRNAGFGIDFIGGTNTGNVISGNTISGNGTATGSDQLSGIGLRSTGSNGNTISNNTFTNNNGAGIIARAGTTGNVFSQNSFVGNGVSSGTGLGLAIDLMNSASTSNGDGVTINDAGDADAPTATTTSGANGLVNFPILQRVLLNSNNTLTITGFARPGARVELYLAAADATGFGEGQTYLATFTQGASTGATGNVTTSLGNVGTFTTGAASTYGPAAINGLSQGTDNTNAFSVTFAPTAAQLALIQVNTSLLTSTATFTTSTGGNFGTSEFSGDVRILTSAPVPNDVTNVDVPNNTLSPVVLNPNLSGTATGLTTDVSTSTPNTIVSYTVSPLAQASSGTLYYQGVAITTSTGPVSVAANNLSQLTFVPAYGFVGNATFTYTATDANGLFSTTHNTGSTVVAGQAVYTIPVVASADVTTTIAGPATLSAGQPSGTFTATFTNNGPGSALTVGQTVALPSGASLTSAQQLAITTAYPGTSFPLVGGVVTISFPSTGSLPSGGSVVRQFAFTAPTSTTATSITSTVTTATNQGVDTAPNSATLNLNVLDVADVATTIVADAAAVAAGSTAQFNVSFFNNGAQSAAGVVGQVQLPLGLLNVTTSAGAYDASTGIITYNIGGLAVNTPASLTVTYTQPVNSSVTAGSAIRTTSYEAGQTANNAATATITPNTTIDVATTITGPGTTPTGAQVTYNVTTRNPATATATTATNVVQTVTLPANATNIFVTGGGTISGSTVTFPTIAALAAGQVVNNTVSFTAPNPSPATSFSVKADVTATGDVATTGNNTSTVATTTTTPGTGSANLYTTVSTPTANVAAGAALTFTITQGNQGLNQAAAVTTTATLPANLAVSTSGTSLLLNGNRPTSVTATTATFTGGSYNLTTGIFTFSTSATQNSNATPASYTLAFNAPASGVITVSANVTSTTPDVMMSNNVASTQVTIDPAATDVTTTLTGPDAATPGQLVTYTVKTTNNGPAAAASVVQTVAIPAGLPISTTAGNNSVTIGGALPTSVTSTTATFADGTTYNSATGIVTFASITAQAAGNTVSNTIGYYVPGNGDASLVNVARVAMTSTDRVLTNNVASMVTTIQTSADVQVALTGPGSAVAGSPITYGVTTTNNGPSVMNTVTTSVQLLAGLSNVSVVGFDGAVLPNSATTGYNSADGIVRFPGVTGQAPGGANASTGSITLVAPANVNVMMPTASATVTGTTDPNLANNSATVATILVPATTQANDLSVSLVRSGATATAGTSINFTVQPTNNSGTAASGVVTTVQLPAGLPITGTTTAVRIAGNLPTSTSGTVASYGSGASAITYDSSTGLVTYPAVSLAANTAGTSSVITIQQAPGTGPVVATAAVRGDQSDLVPANNSATQTIDITAVPDVATTVTGPGTAPNGAPVSYTVVTSSNGPSPALSVTQTVTLPSGITGYSVNGGPAVVLNGGSPTTAPTVVSLPVPATIAAGPANSVANVISFTSPASGSTFNVVANATATGDAATTGNNTSTQPTARFSQPPVATNVTNSLQAPEGNTATAAMPISPLAATSALSTIKQFNLTSFPPTSQGVLYYDSNPTGAANYVAITSTNFNTVNLTPAQASSLRFLPASGYVGNATFTYTATDNTTAAALSNVATYLIPVGQDLNSTAGYTPVKGSTNPYMLNDVISYIIDNNGAQYTNNGTAAGIVYNATTGALQPTAANGLPTATGSINAVLVSGTLPLGTSLNPTTGQIFVSNPSLLPKRATSTSVTIRTTDIYGGVNTVTETLNLGDFPLPVELSAFSAQAVNNRDGLLQWTTAAELNNDHFELERSFDGTTFARFAQVAGQGTKLTPTDYRFTDAGVGAKVAAGQPVYYRLKQVDTDGTSSYSPVRTVSFSPAAVTITLFPNPAATSSTLELSQLPATGKYEVTLLDATGRTVLQTTLGGGLPQPLDLRKLASGTYNVLVTGQQANGSALRQVLRLIKE